MKNIFFLVVMTVISFNLKAQEETIHIKKGQSIEHYNKGAYYKFPTDKYQSFLGSWKTENGKFKLDLKLKKIFQEGPDIYIDQMLGTLCMVGFSCKENFWELKASRISDKNPHISTFIIFDSNGNSKGVLVLELAENGSSLTWKVKNREGFKVKSEELDQNLPKNLSMEKIN